MGASGNDYWSGYDLEYSTDGVALIPLTFFKSRPVIFISLGKLYSSLLTSIHSTPSVVYCTLAFWNVSL